MTLLRNKEGLSARFLLACCSTNGISEWYSYDTLLYEELKLCGFLYHGNLVKFSIVK